MSVKISQVDDAKVVKKQKISQFNSLWIVTWNTDGLEPYRAIERAEEICSIVLEGRGEGDELNVPHVVFLQEVTPQTCAVFIERFCNQGFMLAPDELPQGAPYFTLVFLRVLPNLKLRWTSRIAFEKSTMGRDLVEVRCSYGDNIEVSFLTAHFESLAQFKDERVSQFRQTLEKMKKFDGISIFGGDTNIRVKEEAELKEFLKSKKLIDCWISDGSSPEKKYTWDLKLNPSKGSENSSFIPRMRLDRLLCHSSKENSIKVIPNTFKLLGTKPMALAHASKESLFPSDHFGLICAVEFN
jgi:hypothetical protein